MMLRSFEPQQLANTAWACANLDFVNDNLLAAFAAAENSHHPSVADPGLAKHCLGVLYAALPGRSALCCDFAGVADVGPPLG